MGKDAAAVKSLSVRRSCALFALSAVHSKGKSDIGCSDMIKAGSPVMERLCLVWST